MGRAARRGEAAKAKAAALVEIETVTDGNQKIVDGASDSIVSALLQNDAAIVADVAKAMHPQQRIARIVKEAARSVSSGTGSPELVEALDDLKYAIAPELKPLPADRIDVVWGFLKIENRGWG